MTWVDILAAIGSVVVGLAALWIALEVFARTFFWVQLPPWDFRCRACGRRKPKTRSTFRFYYWAWRHTIYCVPSRGKNWSPGVLVAFAEACKAAWLRWWTV